MKFLRCFALLCLLESSSGINMKIKDFKVCDPKKKYLADLKVELGKTNVVKYGSLNMSVPIDDDPATITLDYSANGKQFLKLGTIKMKACDAVQRYGGPLWFDLQSAAHLQKFSCPIPKGMFEIRNFTIDFNRLGLQTFPNGLIRCTVYVLQKISKKEIICYVTHLEHL